MSILLNATIILKKHFVNDPLDSKGYDNTSNPSDATSSNALKYIKDYF